MWFDEDVDDLERCDGYVVLVADPRTGEADCYGPFLTMEEAAEHVMRSREDLSRAEFDDVVVEVVRWHRR